MQPDSNTNKSNVNTTGQKKFTTMLNEMNLELNPEVMKMNPEIIKALSSASFSQLFGFKPTGQPMNGLAPSSLNISQPTIQTGPPQNLQFTRPNIGAIFPAHEKSIDTVTELMLNENQKLVEKEESSKKQSNNSTIENTRKRKQPFDSSESKTTKEDGVSQIQKKRKTAEEISSAEEEKEEILHLKEQLDELQKKYDDLSSAFESQKEKISNFTQMLLGIGEEGKKVGVVLTVDGSKIVGWNSTLRDALGYNEDDLFVAVKSWRDLIHPAHWAEVFSHFLDAIRYHKESFFMQFCAKHKSGHLIGGAKANTIVSFDSGTNKPLFSLSFITIPKQVVQNTESPPQQSQISQPPQSINININPSIQIANVTTTQNLTIGKSETTTINVNNGTMTLPKAHLG